MSNSAAFFREMAPTLTANILTVTLVYCFFRFGQIERRGGEGRLHYLWLIVMVFLMMLYGFYTWKNSTPGPSGLALEEKTSGTPTIRSLTPDRR